MSAHLDNLAVAFSTKGVRGYRYDCPTISPSARAVAIKLGIYPNYRETKTEKSDFMGEIPRMISFHAVSTGEQSTVWWNGHADIAFFSPSIYRGG